MEENNTVESLQADTGEPVAPPGCQLKWQYLEEGRAADHGAAYCTVADELHFACQGGAPFALRWADIDQVQDDGIVITLSMADGTVFRLSMLGRLHDSVLDALMACWTKANRKQALSEESLLASFRARAALQGSAPLPCGVGVYRTAVVLDFADGAVTRLPLVLTDRPLREEWSFCFRLSAETWVVSHFARETDAFVAAVESAMGALEAAAAERARKLCPQAPPMRQRALAALLLDGRAAGLRQARQSYEPLANALVASLAEVGLREAWEALVPLGLAEDARIGEKADLRSEGAYRFFLLPVVRDGRAAILFEAASQQDAGRATYVFRVPGGMAPNEAMDMLNAALVCVNFRREPIYLSDEQLRRPQYANYARSVERVPSLAALRQAYVGRVAHSTPEAWLGAVKGLLEQALAR